MLEIKPLTSLPQYKPSERDAREELERAQERDAQRRSRVEGDGEASKSQPVTSSGHDGPAPADAPEDDSPQDEQAKGTRLNVYA